MENRSSKTYLRTYVHCNIIHNIQGLEATEKSINRWTGKEHVVCIYQSVSSAAQSGLTLCNPVDCSTQGFPVHHQLPELSQTHVHRIGDAIQPSHPLLSPSSPAFSLSQHQGLFYESVLHIRWQKYWNFSTSPSNEYSGLISFGTDWCF